VRGLAHVGVLRVLTEAGVPIDSIAGVSMGAIVATAYALTDRFLTLNRPVHSRAPRNRKALPTTDTELKLIAAAAIIGLSSSPKKGYSTPAATGTPIEL